MSSAHAKAHLRHLVTEEDATAAIELLHYALFSEERSREGDIAEIDETEELSTAARKRQKVREKLLTASMAFDSLR